MKANRCRTQWITLDHRPVRYLLLAPSAERDSPTTLGLPLLLLHGLGCSADAWRPSLRCLERQGLTQAALAPDLPGYGRSLGPPEALGMAELADWVTDFLDAQGIDQAHVAGNSMGCQVALALARRHPTRVGGMVLAGPTAGEQFTPWWRSLLGLVLDGGREPLLYRALLLRMYAQMGPWRYLQTVRKMLADDPVAQGAAVKASCLVVRGERDPIVPDPDARRLAAALPEGRFTTVYGAAHAVQFNTPAIFIPTTMAFLAGTETVEKSPGMTAPLLSLPPRATGAVPGARLPLPSQISHGQSWGRGQGVGVKWVSVDGRRVRCRLLAPTQHGYSQSAIELPLLLLHGLAGSAEGWTRTLRCLKRQERAQPVVAPDLPGYGWSQGPPETWGMDALADWSARSPPLPW
jgi:2-hydroxy-6-oxonona-2,4-dienedioate hydrolase